MRIGLGIVAYARPEYLKQCLESLKQNNWGGADVIRVGIDFKDKETSRQLHDICADYAVMSHTHKSNVGVAANKNGLICDLYNNDCDHIFLMEDDITMVHKDTCKAYIDEAQRLGIEHMNFAHHGTANVGGKRLYRFPNGQTGFVYPNCIGAFSYYSRRYIDEVGMMDERFKNAWEHVEHTYRGCLKGLCPPFWYFPDHPISHKLLKEIPGSIENSAIRNRTDWKENMEKGKIVWVNKHGMWLPPHPEGYYVK